MGAIMKTAGIVILALGLLMTLYTGVTYITRETVVDAGPIHITRDDEHSVNWQPYIGVGLMIIGVAALILSRKGVIAA
jgi:hypothetical protein